MNIVKQSDLRYDIFVKFNSGEKIHVNENEIMITLKSKRERNKANREPVDKLAVRFGIPKDRMRIIAGMRSSKKIVEVLEEII